jgi:hypothetical protein
MNLVRLGGVRRVVSLPARFKTKAVLSTAFRLEGVSGLRPVLWLGQPGAGQRGGSVAPSGPPRQFWVKVND